MVTVLNNQDISSVSTPVSAAKAHELILRGDAPANMKVRGHLSFSADAHLSELPAGLVVTNLTLRDNQSLRSLPPGLSVTFRLDLTNCTQLETLPENLTAGSLVLSGCTALTSLPEGLEVSFLDISDCEEFTTWPASAAVDVGRLIARNCVQLNYFPSWLTNLTQLDLRGCVSLAELPEGLYVSAWVDVADTQIRALPHSMQGVQLRWREVAVDERVAFHPETITAQEVLAEANVELRRVKLERMGYEVFLRVAAAKTLDEDCDAGGARRLLRIELHDDEPLVCVSLICPSTERQYIIRVPPAMRSCRQAVAWVAGFDDPDDYAPLVET